MNSVRNIYKDDVDFSALALQDPEFNKHLKFNGQLDFSNPEAVQQLTKSLLKRDFGLQIELPDDRLCPPVPNRYYYILWVQELLDSTSENYTDQISFTICNPPFYASNDELLASAKAKSRPPHSSCTGADVEMVTPGGEVSFVSRMIEESCTLKERVQCNVSLDSIVSRINTTIQDLDIRWQYRPSISTGIGFAKENVWSRSARRNKQKRDSVILPAAEKAENDAMQEDSDEDEDEEPALGFKVQVRQAKVESGVEVTIRWLQGTQSVLFESFCGMLKRQISLAADG
ncbi:MAG: hypothetical protein Q9187_006646 [Circinaria calcarea]